jgi:hypothetical protein
MKMGQKQLASWAKTRQKGRTRYIWLYGVAGWGLATGVFWAVAMAAWQGWDRLPLLLPLALVAFPIGGFFFGRRMWNVFEEQFQQASRDKPDA